MGIKLYCVCSSQRKNLFLFQSVYFIFRLEFYYGSLCALLRIEEPIEGSNWYWISVKCTSKVWFRPSVVFHIEKSSSFTRFSPIIHFIDRKLAFTWFRLKVNWRVSIWNATPCWNLFTRCTINRTLRPFGALT